MIKLVLSLFIQQRGVILALLILSLILGGIYALPMRQPVAAQAGAARVVPDTTNGIFVWNDQLLTRAMTEEQFKFAATHYVGTQKLLRSHADHLRSYNPNFLVLHYRLGQELAHSSSGNCQPGGDLIKIIEGDQWINEWPGEAVVKDNWFFHYNGASRVFFCDWGSYLMNTDDAGWQNYWLGEVTRQLAANDDDGVFMDSTSVPNYLGTFSPAFPAQDQTFESQWSDKIKRWLTLAKQRVGSRYLLIPNTGHWVTTRDATDYSPADGVMIEGFGKWRQDQALELPDWQLQMNRILSLERQDKVVIAESYINNLGDLQSRNFYVANYLLIKGRHTFINLELGLEPEWFPEYDLKLGSPVDALPASVDGWRDAATGLYRRSYTGGQVVVNPTNTARTINFGQTLYLAQASGGGNISAAGVPDGSLSYQAVTSVMLAPTSAAILLNALPSAGSTVTNVSAASYLASDIATESIVSAFGTNLATGTQGATSLPLPTNLAGTSVTVRDSLGAERTAALFFVSATQVNYQVPPGTAAGLATIKVTSGNGSTATGTMNVKLAAPTLFAADASGKGLAAAQVVRVRGGVQSFELAIGFDISTKRFFAVPIDLGPDLGSASDQVFLTLYGTGIRRRSSLSAVSVRIGGVDAPVQYAGAQGLFVGLDQVNVLVPRSLAGRGAVDVAVTVDGQAANLVQVSIK